MRHLDAKAKLLQRSKVKMAARRVHTAPGGGRAVEGVEVEPAPRILPYSCSLVQFPWER